MNMLAHKLDNTDPLLLPPREVPYVLKDVLEKRVYGCRDELVLDLEDCFLRFGVDIDTDTITNRFQEIPFRAKNGFVSIQSAKPWKRYLGKECGWTWLAWNQQGYLDSVLISFDGIEPNVLLQTIASSIEVFRFHPRIRRLLQGRTGTAGAVQEPNGNNKVTEKEFTCWRPMFHRDGEKHVRTDNHG